MITSEKPTTTPSTFNQRSQDKLSPPLTGSFDGVPVTIPPTFTDATKLNLPEVPTGNVKNRVNAIENNISQQVRVPRREAALAPSPEEKVIDPSVLGKIEKSVINNPALSSDLKPQDAKVTVTEEDLDGENIVFQPPFTPVKKGEESQSTLISSSENLKPASDSLVGENNTSSFIDKAPDRSSSSATQNLATDTESESESPLGIISPYPTVPDITNENSDKKDEKAMQHIRDQVTTKEYDPDGEQFIWRDCDSRPHTPLINSAIEPSAPAASAEILSESNLKLGISTKDDNSDMLPAAFAYPITDKGDEYFGTASTSLAAQLQEAEQNLKNTQEHLKIEAYQQKVQELHRLSKDFFEKAANALKSANTYKSRLYNKAAKCYKEALGATEDNQNNLSDFLKEAADCYSYAAEESTGSSEKADSHLANAIRCYDNAYTARGILTDYWRNAGENYFYAEKTSTDNNNKISANYLSAAKNYQNALSYVQKDKNLPELLRLAPIYSSIALCYKCAGDAQSNSDEEKYNLFRTAITNYKEVVNEKLKNSGCSKKVALLYTEAGRSFFQRAFTPKDTTAYQYFKKTTEQYEKAITSFKKNINKWSYNMEPFLEQAKAYSILAAKEFKTYKTDYRKYRDCLGHQFIFSDLERTPTPDPGCTIA